MLRIGDTVKVIGNTVEKNEYIAIGTVCTIIDIDNTEEEGLIVEILPNSYPRRSTSYGYWYLACDVEKGHMEWVKDD